MKNQASQLQETWEIYTAAWKVKSKEEKLALFARSLTIECTYSDPTVKTEGWEALAANMLGFHQQVPGGHFVTTYFLAHSDKSITRWEMRNQEGEMIGDGISYGEYNTEGKLTSMTGFFEAP